MCVCVCVGGGGEGGFGKRPQFLLDFFMHPSLDIYINTK